MRVFCSAFFCLPFFIGVSKIEGERGVAVLQQRGDGGVPSAQGGHDAHGEDELTLIGYDILRSTMMPYSVLVFYCPSKYHVIPGIILCGTRCLA